MPSYTRDRVLFESPMVRIGLFRARPEDQDFAEAGEPACPVFVFPRTGVWIERANCRPFVADPSVITLYNCSEPYRRRPLSPRGDQSDYFAIDELVALEVVSRHAPSVLDRPEQPFRFARAHCAPHNYLLQRSVVRRLQSGASVDPLWVEELALTLLERLVADAYAEPRPRRRAEPRPAHRELAEAARARLGADVEGQLPLSRLAAELGVSVAHLCRVFRRATGSTLHAYRNEIRLRTALGPALRRGSDLTGVALDHGFSSHSHFTAVFRRRFGVTPSAARGRSIS